VVNKLRVAFGHRPSGVEYNANDSQPVNNFFPIVAPPLEVSNQYLPVLGKLAQFAKDPEITKRLAELATPDEFLALLEEKAQ
jgi:mannitol/fructose-specific phosphotransferase system IIA component (Ntr-type)